MSTARKPPPDRAEFPHFRTIPTRWMDNDVYGHINNVVYYSYFDTLVNRFLIDEAGLDFTLSPVICIVAETSCRYYASFAYPDDIEAGLAISRLGKSSVTYEIGLFASGEASARAHGSFVHVFVDRITMRPVPVPTSFKTALESLISPTSL